MEGHAMNSKARFTVVMIFCLGLMMGHLLHRPASRFNIDSRVDTWHYFQQDEKQYRTNDRTSEIQEVSDGLWTNSQELIVKEAAKQEAESKRSFEDVRGETDRANAALELQLNEMSRVRNRLQYLRVPQDMPEPEPRVQLIPDRVRH